MNIYGKMTEVSGFQAPPSDVFLAISRGRVIFIFAITIQYLRTFNLFSVKRKISFFWLFYFSQIPR